MAIPASQIVNISSRVISAGGTDLEITGLFLTSNPLCPHPTPLSFSSSTAVSAYFGTASSEYAAAVKYFLGYDNSFKKPRKIHFARLALTEISGALIGGQAQNMATLKGISNGTLTITIDGEEKTANTLNFADATTQSDVAQVVASALDGVTVAYNSNLNAFVITSKTNGNSSAVSVATGTAADALGLSVNAGATVSAGSDALTPSQNMDSIKAQTQNWASFTTLDAVSADNVLAFGAWANDQQGEYLYCPYTDNVADTIPSNSTNLPNRLKAANYEGVLLTFGTINHAILPVTIGACIDWDRVNAMPTYAFRVQSGLTPSVDDEITAVNLLKMNCNFYGRYATRNDEFIEYYEGRMSGGIFGFADAFIGNLWLHNTLQVAIMSGLQKIGRVGYHDRGYTNIRAWCADPITRAKKNGVIDAGVELDEAQKATLFNEIGQDVSDEIFTNGYYLLIADPGAQARVNRDTPQLGLWYTYGGSVHRVNLPVTAVL